MTKKTLSVMRDIFCDRVYYNIRKVNGNTNAYNERWDNLRQILGENLPTSYIESRLEFYKRSKAQLERLKAIPKIEQRSKEWYKIRNGMITASDFGSAINKGHYGNQYDLIKKKVNTLHGNPPEFKGNVATEWGVKYEDVACEIYKKKNNGMKVYDFGLVPHKSIKYLGASPDGINELGIMLEIKCPWRRKLTGEIPEQYWVQMQGQMEICELEECDYLECTIREYEYEDEFLTDSNPETAGALSRNLGEKGIVIGYRNLEETQKYTYIYSKLGQSAEAMMNWKDEKIAEFDISIDFKVDYWYLEGYDLKRVYRDADFCEELIKNLGEVWNKVLFYAMPDNKVKYLKDICKKAPANKDTDSNTSVSLKLGDKNEIIVNDKMSDTRAKKQRKIKPLIDFEKKKKTKKLVCPFTDSDED